MSLHIFKPICKITDLPPQIAELQEGYIRAENLEHAKVILSMQLAMLFDHGLKLDNQITDTEKWTLEEKGCVTAGWVKDKI